MVGGNAVVKLEKKCIIVSELLTAMRVFVLVLDHNHT